MGVVQEDEGVIECGHDILDLAGGGIGPSLGLPALNLDALLLGLQDLFGDAALVVTDEFVQAAVVAF